MPGCKRQALLLCGHIQGHARTLTQRCRSFHRSPQCRTRERIESEHAALINPLSLGKTLGSIKEANRTRLIGKVEGQFSERLSLSKILDLPEKQVSKDIAAIQLCEGRWR